MKTNNIEIFGNENYLSAELDKSLVTLTSGLREIGVQPYLGIARLRESWWLYRGENTRNVNVPTRPAVQMGYFVLVKRTMIRGLLDQQTYFTPEGLAYFRENRNEIFYDILTVPTLPLVAAPVCGCEPEPDAIVV